MEELAQIANPDEISIGDSGEESGGEEGVVEEVPVGIERQVIPSAVFGSIPEDKQGEVLGSSEEVAMGAKQRLTNKK
jgi:hypothetical protein